MNLDNLAAIRTHLANERTVLAYVRTSLTFMAAGAGLIEFFSSPISALIAWTFIVVGGFVLVIGIARFIRAGRRINELSTCSGFDDYPGRMPVEPPTAPPGTPPLAES